MIMTLKDMIKKLQEDQSREYSHWLFYAHAAIMVEGLHREEYREFFLDEAKDEMNHVIEFGDLIAGLGGTPKTKIAEYKSDLTSPVDLLHEALKMEKEVVKNYVERQNDAEELEENGGEDEVHGRYINIFLDDQIKDSRQTVDHLEKILANPLPKLHTKVSK